MQGAFLIVFTLFWSGMVMMFDGLMGRGIINQYESRQFPSVAGTVLRSEVETHHSSKGGTSYSAVIQYRFDVDGRTFTADKLRFSGFGSGSATASAAVNAHPVGSAVQVFYDPANPQDALLFPGLAGGDLMLPLFLTPFNMVMFGLWIWIASWLRERLFRPMAGGVKIITDGMTTRIRLPQFPPIGWGLATTGGLGFAAIFAVGLPTDMQPSISLAAASLAAVYGAGLVAFLWQRGKINSGLDDLVLNEASRSLEMPLTFGRKQRVTVSFANIRSLWVEPVEHRSSKGGVSYTYAPTLQMSGPEAGSQKIADWSDKMKADGFTAWLRTQLGANLPDSPVADEAESAVDDFPGGAPAPVARPEHSRVRVSDGPDGREFYFPPARNIGAAMFLTFFFLIWSGFFYFMLVKKAPILFPIVWGVTDVLLAFGLVNVWFKSSRVTIDSTGVRATNRYLIFSRTRRFAAADVARFATQAGMQSGSKVFTNIKLVPIGSDDNFAAAKAKYQQTGQMPPLRFRISSPGGVTVAGSIASADEAAWLVQEMNKALGRK